MNSLLENGALSRRLGVSSRCLEAALGAGVDDRTLWWTESVQQSSDTDDGDRFAAVAARDFCWFEWGLVRAGASTTPARLAHRGYRAASRTVAVSGRGRCEQTRHVADVRAGGSVGDLATARENAHAVGRLSLVRTSSPFSAIYTSKFTGGSSVVVLLWSGCARMMLRAPIVCLPCVVVAWARNSIAVYGGHVVVLKVQSIAPSWIFMPPPPPFCQFQCFLQVVACVWVLRCVIPTNGAWLGLRLNFEPRV